MRRTGLAGVAGAAVILCMTPRAAFAATPYLQLYPTAVSVGQRVTAYGSDFCSSGCSQVTITVGTHVAASGVTVSADGKFQAAFSVNVTPGSYRVIASQTTADGLPSSASAFLQVAATDTAASPKPGTTPGPASPPAGPSPTPGVPSGTPSAWHSLTTNGASSPGVWIAAILVAGAILLAVLLVYRRLND